MGLCFKSIRHLIVFYSHYINTRDNTHLWSTKLKIDTKRKKEVMLSWEPADLVLPAYCVCVWLCWPIGVSEWQWMREKLQDRAGDLQMGTWGRCEHSYCISGLTIPRGGGPLGLALNHGPFNRRTGKHLPSPLQSPAFHLQSKSETQGAWEPHQRAFW